MDLNSSSSGVAAMLRFALYAEDELGITTLELGRQGLDRKDSCTWSGTGKHLCFNVMIDGWNCLCLGAADGFRRRTISVGNFQ